MLTRSPKLSGLILPKGVSFKIDELKLHGRISAFEGTGTLPPDFDEIWKKNFSTAGFKDLDIAADPAAEGKKSRDEHKKFGLSRLFKAVHSALEEYDPKKHGPLVDIRFKPQPGVEEVEIYPVNPPYSYIQIIYDHSTHEYTYRVLEPVLTEPEIELLKELKERLFETLDINTKDISKEEAGIKSAGCGKRCHPGFWHQTHSCTARDNPLQYAQGIPRRRSDRCDHA